MNTNKRLDTLNQNLSALKTVPKPIAPKPKRRTPPFFQSAFNEKKTSSNQHSMQSEDDHERQVAFHIAGHAAAIYLNNKASFSPSSIFQIRFQQRNCDSRHRQTIQCQHIVRIDDDERTIQPFPRPVTRSADETDGPLRSDDLNTCDTDIINLLAGPLAEARYIHDCDNELLTRRLIDLEALKQYGGDSDLLIARQNLRNLLSVQSEQDKKLEELLTAAFYFVNDDNNWSVIIRLAEYLFKHHKKMMSSEEVASVLEPLITDDAASSNPNCQPSSQTAFEDKA